MKRIISHQPGFVCAAINRKGGTGKTICTINIAAELALRGYHVGIIDVDSQGSASLYFGMQQEDNLFKALIGVQKDGDEFLPVPLENLVRVVPPDAYLAPDVDGENVPTGLEQEPGKLVILPSYLNTYRIPYFLDDAEKFTELVERMIELYALDFLLIDTAPTMSMFDGAVYAAAHGFLYVTEPEIGSLQGLQDSFDQVQRMNRRRVKRGQRTSAVIGIVPNKVRSLREHIDNLDAIKEAFPELYFPQLRLLKTYPAANKYGMTVRAYAPRTPEAYEILQVVNRFEQVVAEHIYNH